MTDLLAHLKTLSRPPVLLTAARFGAKSYKRSRDLSRIFRTNPNVAIAPVLERLITIEETLEARRLTHDANYSASQHVDAMAALLAEAQSQQASKAEAQARKPVPQREENLVRFPSYQTKASGSAAFLAAT